MKKIAMFGILVLMIAGIAVYLYVNQGHRDVYNSEADLKVDATEIVNEFLGNASEANKKYLSSDGESKIIEVSGVFSSLSEDIEGNAIVLIQGTSSDAGVNCKMLPDYKSKAASLKQGEKVVVKGVVRAGAYYDEDLEMYDHVILDQCSIVE